MITINVKPFLPSFYNWMACKKKQTARWSEHRHRPSMMGEFRSPQKEKKKRENVNVQIDITHEKNTPLHNRSPFFCFSGRVFQQNALPSKIIHLEGC
jgi:hypothetical protein